MARDEERRGCLYAKAANGLTVRIPAERYKQWRRAQEAIKAGTERPERGPSAALVKLMTGGV